MSLLSTAIHNLWTRILDNKGKLTASGGFILGIILTLTFKDLYPDLEYSFRQRMCRLRGQAHLHPLPGQRRFVRLEDHTTGDTSQGVQDDSDQTQGQENDGVRDGVEGLIGNTPLIKLRALSEATGCEILAKAEFLNGAGNSPKDRVALSMIMHAEEEGLLHPGQGDTIYEGTVGSTGISLAAVCRARGYKAYMYVTDIRFESCKRAISLMSLPDTR
nr:cysteine synthase 2 [Quercus suber]